MIEARHLADVGVRGATRGAETLASERPEARVERIRRQHQNPLSRLGRVSPVRPAALQPVHRRDKAATPEICQIRQL